VSCPIPKSPAGAHPTAHRCEGARADFSRDLHCCPRRRELSRLTTTIRRPSKFALESFIPASWRESMPESKGHGHAKRMTPILTSAVHRKLDLDEHPELRCRGCCVASARSSGPDRVRRQPPARRPRTKSFCPHTDDENEPKPPKCRPPAPKQRGTNVFTENTRRSSGWIGHTSSTRSTDLEL
jgi:hypothetical protein